MFEYGHFAYVSQQLEGRTRMYRRQIEVGERYQGLLRSSRSAQDKDENKKNKSVEREETKRGSYKHLQHKFLSAYVLFTAG